MPLKKRERILAIATAVFVVLFLGYWLLNSWGGSGGRLQSQHDDLVREIDRKNRQIKKGHEAEARLTQWQHQSLPSDLELARSAYQNWLLASAEAAGFRATKVEASQGRQQGDTYRTLRFRLQAETTLEDLTRFLHTFYSAGYLHQIQSLNVVPKEEGKKVDLTLSIEALALSAAPRTQPLPEKPATPLLAADSADYSKAIAGRNIFAPVKKAAPVAAPVTPPPAFDPSRFVVLTAVVTVADRPQAWIVNRTSGELFKLHEGEEFRVGDHHGKVRHIGHREAEVELDGQKHLLSLGKTLDGSLKLP